ncbi:MAG: inorganic phosphate transporter [Elusimicrobia bacterium]|nr:inorganic phosphate transporter [Candidatus Obscuribacterium magneticum]
MISLHLLIAVIFLALAFDFINGFHDSANSIATVVSTRVLSPRVAVLWAAFFNFVAAFMFEIKVAATIGKGVIRPEVVNVQVIVAGLVAAIIWNLLTWYWGLPSSSSHTLIGGFAGAAIMRAGFGCVIGKGMVKIVSFIFISPILGFVLGFLFMVIVLNLFHRKSPAWVDKVFRRGQLLSAAFYSLGHGTNDAQKTMGIIYILLIASGRLTTHSHVPVWVILACHAAMGLGTLFGGWRIVKTMGQKMVKLRPVDGFCAETGGAIMLLGTALGGIPVSTTHTITGAIMGVGATNRLSAVKWGVATKIVWAWILTIPVSALIGMINYKILCLFS